MRVKHCLLSAAVACAASIAGTSTLLAAEGVELRQLDWPTSGAFGSFDRAATQRGFQVYREVCAACHGVHFVAYRTLSSLGYTDDQIKAFAAQATVNDGPNDEGEMFDRPAVGPHQRPLRQRAGGGGR